MNNSNSDKDVFLGKKILREEEWSDGSFGRLKRSMKVLVQKSVPVYKTKSGEKKEGLPQVDVIFERGSNRIYMTPEEAQKFSGVIAYMRNCMAGMVEECIIERRKKIAEGERNETK